MALLEMLITGVGPLPLSNTFQSAGRRRCGFLFVGFGVVTAGRLNEHSITA